MPKRVAVLTLALITSIVVGTVLVARHIDAEVERRVKFAAYLAQVVEQPPCDLEAEVEVAKERLRVIGYEEPFKPYQVEAELPLRCK